MSDNDRPTASESVENDEETINDASKGIFTNALRYATSVYEAKSLILENPPELIYADAIAMGECIANETIRLLQENVLVHDEVLMLHDESDKDEAFEECTFDADEPDSMFNPEDFKEPSKDYIPLSYKEKAVAFAEAHPKYSLKTLQASGFSRLTRKEYLQKWKDDVKNGGTRIDKLRLIDSETFEKFKEARAHHEQVTTRTIQQWAMSFAFPLLSDKFTFIASNKWARNFKNKHGIRQRKVTKFVSKNDMAALEETIVAAERFQKQIRLIMGNWNPKFIINTDQTGCTYESMFNRSLDYKGSEAVYVQKKNLAKTTHSYTAQYALTFSGELLPRVFLCMQEVGNSFSPRVAIQVEQLELEYGNVVVTCSKSGKLTTDLYRQFLGDIISPFVGDNDFLLLIDSWSGQVDNTLYDEVFVNPIGKATCTIKVIPPKCTPLCQPCDIYFYRQVKNIIKKIQSAPDLLEMNRELSSREDAIKIHSIVHWILSAPAFKNMILYAWYGSKLSAEKRIFRNVNQVCFPVTLLKKKCTCDKVAFIFCPWCELNVCFSCFYDDYHPKKCTSANKN